MNAAILPSLGGLSTLRRVAVDGHHVGCVQSDDNGQTWAVYPSGAVRPIGRRASVADAARMLVREGVAA